MKKNSSASVEAGSPKAPVSKRRRKKNIRIALTVVIVYLIVVAAAAVTIDAPGPSVALNGLDAVTIEYGSSYIDEGAAGRLCGRIFPYSKPLEVSVSGYVDTFALGDYRVEFSSSFLWKTASVSRTVTVIDTVPPEIELLHTDGDHGDLINGYIEEGYYAFDNCDGDITDRVEKTETREKIIYTVRDSSGNECTVERKLDYIITLTLNDDEYISIPAALEFTDPGYSAVDGAGNDCTGYVTVSGEVIPYVPGTYELTYSVENDKGCLVSKTRLVEVYPVEMPNTIIPDSKVIYLTFDDGPGPYTDDLLDILGKYGVKATFFVTGNGGKYTDCIGRAWSEGHSIGVHTYCHEYNDIYASLDAFLYDFNRTEELIYSQTGSYTRLFRFPGGSSNTVSNFNPGIMSTLTTVMTDLGYKYFDWNVVSGDAGETTKTKVVYSNVTEGINTCGTSYAVILQHDIKDFSVAAVEDIILWGFRNGYEFRALDLTSPGTHHAVNN